MSAARTSTRRNRPVGRLAVLGLMAAMLTVSACAGVTITPREPFTADDVKR